MDYIVTALTVLLTHFSSMHMQLVNIIKNPTTPANHTIFFIHSLLTLIRDGVMKEKNRRGEVVIMLPPPYIGSGCVANEMDDTDDMLLIQW